MVHFWSMFAPFGAGLCDDSCGKHADRHAHRRRRQQYKHDRLALEPRPYAATADDAAIADHCSMMMAHKRPSLASPERKRAEFELQHTAAVLCAVNSAAGYNNHLADTKVIEVECCLGACLASAISPALAEAPRWRWRARRNRRCETKYRSCDSLIGCHSIPAGRKCVHAIVSPYDELHSCSNFGANLARRQQVWVPDN